MKKRTTNTSTPDILVTLKRRMPGGSRLRLDLARTDAIGLLILPVPDLHFYADVVSKSANVVVSEIFSSRSQHITTLVISDEVTAMHEVM